ncbi:MAG: HAD-IB family hydrolase [Gammaproteobacteria bacterium]|nr:HAD-IB family hydrolase [Gammaproteobacteria bacterium]
MIQHQLNGADIVLVSGSFFACLSSFAEKFNIKHVLATILEEKNNKLTGEILAPQTIGEGKAQAVRLFLANQNFTHYQHCYAYGDHMSDVPMLSLVGHPYVVGGDKEIVDYAKSKGWKIINHINKSK